ncbi:SCO family protein [Salibacteraceae bacterium]|nr:SCO family protein [Salibacteraceae bacterium]
MGKRHWIALSSAIILAIITFSCDEKIREELSVLGPYEIHDAVVDGKMKLDTVYTQVKPFQFFDQDSNVVDHSTIDGKVYVTDFFFTSCPTICPKMKQQMLRIYNELDGEEDLLFLSHSIDPVRDSVARLNTFAKKLGIESSRWHMLTGDRDSIYSMAKHYMIAAQKDDLAPGGYAHSGAFLLVDRNKHIRGIYDGVDPESVDELIVDVKQLLKNQ